MTQEERRIYLIETLLSEAERYYYRGSRGCSSYIRGGTGDRAGRAGTERLAPRAFQYTYAEFHYR